MTAPPEKGKANKALVELLAKQLGVKKSQVELVSGDTSAKKVFLIRGASLAEIVDRVRQLLDDDLSTNH